MTDLQLEAHDLDAPRVTVLAASSHTRDRFNTNDVVAESARTYVRLLASSELVSMSLEVVEMTGPARLARHIDRVSRTSDAILITGVPAPLFAETDQLRSRTFDGVLINETSLAAVSIVVGALEVLDRRGIHGRDARVAVIDPQRCPDVSDIVTGLGVTELAFFRHQDFVSRQQLWPLPVDIVIDLSQQNPRTRPRAKKMVVSYPEEVSAACNGFAGPLLSALCGHGVRELTPEILVAATHAVRTGTELLRSEPRYQRQLLAHAIGRAAPDS